MYFRKLQESTIVGDYAKSVDADNLEELLEIKKSFETRIIESFENNENGEQIR